jgi:hypothetical protein
LLALLLRITGKLKPAVAGTAIFVLLMRHPAFVGDGNFTESYALLPQVAGLAMGYHFLTRPNARSAFWFGAAGALAFLIKPTTIGITVAFVPALILTRHPMLWRRPSRSTSAAELTCSYLVAGTQPLRAKEKATARVTNRCARRG